MPAPTPTSWFQSYSPTLPFPDVPPPPIHVLRTFPRAEVGSNLLQPHSGNFVPYLVSISVTLSPIWRSLSPSPGPPLPHRGGAETGEGSLTVVNIYLPLLSRINDEMPLPMLPFSLWYFIIRFRNLLCEVGCRGRGTGQTLSQTPKLEAATLGPASFTRELGAL